MRDWKIIGATALWAATLVALVGFVLTHDADGQEPEPNELSSVPTVTWAEKLRTSIESGEAVVLTAEEAQQLATDYNGSQVADVAVSGTRCYALSPTGTVLASAEVTR